MKVINYLLGYKNLKIYQDTEMFRFSLDSILLPNFVTIRTRIEKILDIGCGNAVIPIILSIKTPAHITGVEIQKDSYDLAIESVKINNLSDKIQILNQDINEYYNECESDVYDVITCNPPYFKVHNNSRLNNNINKTIARHEDNLNLNNIFFIAKKLLKNNGVIAIVHRPERLVEIIENMKKNNIEPKRIKFVYPKHNKKCNTVLIEGSKNGKPGLKIEEPLFVHDDNNNYSVDVLKYFE